MPEIDQSNSEPSWLWRSKRLFPNLIFASIISLMSLAVTTIFAAVTLTTPNIIALPICLAFAALTFFSAAAARSHLKRNPESQTAASRSVERTSTTMVLIVLLICVYSWLLTLGMTIVDIFGNGQPNSKYWLTATIAVISSLFARIWGRKIIANKLGIQGGRNLTLSASQSAIVVMVTVGFAIYIVWALN